MNNAPTPEPQKPVQFDEARVYVTELEDCLAAFMLAYDYYLHDLDEDMRDWSKGKLTGKNGSLKEAWKAVKSHTEFTT